MKLFDDTKPEHSFIVSPRGDTTADQRCFQNREPRRLRDSFSETETFPSSSARAVRDFRASHPQQVSREAEVISDNKSHTRRP